MKKIRLSWKKCRILLMVICMLAAGICYSCDGSGTDSGPVRLELEDRETESSEKPEESYPPGDTREQAENGTDSEETEAGEAGSEETAKIASGSKGTEENTAEPLSVYVHVCGCVIQPGVYALPAGSRIYEALEAAGGITEEGAGDFLNLAREVEDGMKVEVPDREQARLWREQGAGPEGTAVSLGQASGGGFAGQGAGTLQTDGGKVNLNTASREELMTLSGIGESRADAIIRYREMYGGFKAIEDVMNVSGIKEGAFEKIKDSITV